MLNFAEQTGSGAVIMVWSLLSHTQFITIYMYAVIFTNKTKILLHFFPIFIHHFTNKTYSSSLLKQIHLCQTNNSSPLPYCQIPHCNSWSSIFSYNQRTSFHFQIHTHSNQITPVCQKNKQTQTHYSIWKCHFISSPKPVLFHHSFPINLQSWPSKQHQVLEILAHCDDSFCKTIRTSRQTNSPRRT